MFFYHTSVLWKRWSVFLLEAVRTPVVQPVPCNFIFWGNHDKSFTNVNTEIACKKNIATEVNLTTFIHVSTKEKFCVGFFKHCLFKNVIYRRCQMRRLYNVTDSQTNAYVALMEWYWQEKKN
jgi:hypothetical protein